MCLLWKTTSDFWEINQKVFRNLIMRNYKKMSFRSQDFGPEISNYLLEGNKWQDIMFDIYINTDFTFFINFLEQIPRLKELKITNIYLGRQLYRKWKIFDDYLLNRMRKEHPEYSECRVKYEVQINQKIFQKIMPKYNLWSSSILILWDIFNYTFKCTPNRGRIFSLAASYEWMKYQVDSIEYETVPMSKTVHELTLFDIPHQWEVSPHLIVKLLMDNIYYDADLNNKTCLFDFWGISLKFNRWTEFEFKQLVQLLNTCSEIKEESKDEKTLSNINVSFAEYTSNSCFSVSLRNCYIFYEDKYDTYLIKSENATLWFGKTCKIFYSDDDIYIFNRFIKMDLEKCTPVDKSDIIHQKFISLTSKATWKGFKEVKRFFAIFNRDFDEIVVRFPTAKIMPRLTEAKLVTFQFDYKYFYTPYKHPISVKLGMSHSINTNQNWWCNLLFMYTFTILVFLPRIECEKRQEGSSQTTRT